MSVEGGMVDLDLKVDFCGDLSVKATVKPVFLEMVIHAYIWVDEGVFVGDGRIVVMIVLSVGSCKYADNLLDGGEVEADVRGDFKGGFIGFSHDDP